MRVKTGIGKARFYLKPGEKVRTSSVLVMDYTAGEDRLIRDRMTGDFYNHGSRTADPAAWAVWQYHDPATGKGVVLAFRRAEAPSETATIELKGVAPELERMQKATGAKHAFQVVMELPFERIDCFAHSDPVIVPARTFLSQLV